MACFHPIDVWQLRRRPPYKRSVIVFKCPTNYSAHWAKAIKIPCGQCVGCRLEHSRQWAIRCVHEASLYTANSFITLTYADEHLPQTGSLYKPDFQKFLKRLKYHSKQDYIRFYMCGEYGDMFGRPHYHACLFDFDFPDKKLYKNTTHGSLYRSALLEDCWKYGFSTIGSVTFQSAAYVARYVMKKINGKKAADHYKIDDHHSRTPEYTTMSLKPAIGLPWLLKYKFEPYPDDFIVLKGKKMRPPKYYDGVYELTYPSDHALMKKRRTAKAEEHEANNTPERLAVREYIQQRKLDLLKRGPE